VESYELMVMLLLVSMGTPRPPYIAWEAVGYKFGKPWVKVKIYISCLQRSKSVKIYKIRVY